MITIVFVTATRENVLCVHITLSKIVPISGRRRHSKKMQQLL